MYEISAKWREYYQELDPARRLRIRDTLFMTEPDDGANEFRMYLYDSRYRDPKNPGKMLDRFLWACVNLPEVYKSSRLFRKSALKETKNTLKTLGFEEYARYGDAGELALYWEIRNTAKRYFKTCDNGGYRRKLFGLIGSTEDERTVQMMKDVYLMTTAISNQLDMKDEMRIWCQAVQDEYRCLDDRAAERYAEYEANKK